MTKGAENAELRRAMSIFLRVPSIGVMADRTRLLSSAARNEARQSSAVNKTRHLNAIRACVTRNVPRKIQWRAARIAHITRTVLHRPVIDMIDGVT